MTLSDAKIKAAKPLGKPYKLTDEGGLHLFIAPTGSRTWRFRYRYDGKEKLLTIGAYPSVGLAKAREARDNARTDIKEGRDPAIVKKRKRLIFTDEANRFEVIAREWHKAKSPQWTERHAADVLRSLERDIFPEFGADPVTEISPLIVLDAVRKIEARDAIETAHRVRQRVSEVFVYAIASGRASNDPAAVIGKALKPVKRGRQPALTDLTEVQGALMAALTTPCHPQTKIALRLLALTVIRPGEIRAATIEEFSGLETDAPIWTVPAERMKMKRDFVVPLSAEAVETVKTAIAFAGNGGLLFPSPRRASQPISENAMGYLLNRAGYYGRQVPHGFRASFSTIMNERFPNDRHVIDFMLAHAPSNKIEAAYNRALYLERRRELAEIWSKMLLVDMPTAASLLTGPRRRV